MKSRFLFINPFFLSYKDVFINLDNKTYFYTY